MSLSAIRTLVDPADPEDVKQVHALQDAIKVEQESAGNFEVPNWDPGQPEEGARRAAGARHRRIPDFSKAFGTKDEVDPVRHLIGTAAAWGGNPDKDAIYLNVTPTKNDGTTVYKLNVKDVPVDGFWSISVYNAEGYFEKNPYDAYTLNNITAKKSADGSIAIQFGGCDGKIAELPADHEGLELHGAALPSARRNPERHWKFPETAARSEIDSALRRAGQRKRSGVSVP